ncbi:polysaccharide deacetylase family protein [Paenibacillus sp. PAMC21692]|uniref:polysaccharide deacetylase family protein n=1 Tax=Paenibacillus sp. PAMC21692 TaxID=2762320 RepID=UPI00164E68A7|nr:polysaccharide deacetylase family protein [Paenibacillus sp. PAMC21692]QNK55395.1 polysaccharide deacetylase family protein [Paenibacillus sp. PAMC21692]
MNLRWTVTIALLLAVQLTGCSSPDGSQAQTPVQTETSEAASAPIQTSTSKPQQTAATSPEPTATPEEASQIPMQYRMNTKTYRFEPIDDGATDKAVLLTFDDGPKDSEVLTSMLDSLDRHGAKAIFFVNGYRVKQNPDLLALIHERGQTIGNHSYDHIDLKKESEEVVEEQLSSVQKNVEALVGIKPRFFRPPYGSGGDSVKNIAKNHGMLYMTWSNGSLDWDKSAKNKPEVVIANVMEQLHPGANILMHELQWTADALDKLLTKLKNEGYSFIDPAAIETTN